MVATAACSRGSHHHARGVVEDVQPETGQIVIAHEDIPGLMPAMTMNFDVADPKLLETLAHGDAIDFEVEFTGKAYVVTKASVRERGVAKIPTAFVAHLAAVGPLPVVRDRVRALVEIGATHIFLDRRGLPDDAAATRRLLQQFGGAG